MTRKNWSNCPTVSSAGFLAGLVGLLVIGCTMSETVTTLNSEKENRSTLDTSSSTVLNPERENRSIANTTDETVQISSDNSTTIQTTSTTDVPEYSGEIGHLEASEDFIDFIFGHDARVIYLDIYFDASPDDRDTIRTEDNVFTLWSQCDDLPANESPSSLYCTGVSFNLRIPAGAESVYGYNQGFQHLKGYWSVRANPGMHQGLLSVTLTAVDTQDAR